MPWRQTPSRKKKAIVFTNETTSTCQYQLHAGFSKVCEIFKIRPRVSHIGLLLWRHFHAPKRDAEGNDLWLVVWHVGQTASWAGFGQWNLPSIPVWRSGYSRLVVFHLHLLTESVSCWKKTHTLPETELLPYTLTNFFLRWKFGCATNQLYNTIVCQLRESPSKYPLTHGKLFQMVPHYK